MTALKMSGVKACGIGLIITAAECLAVYKMNVPEVTTGAAEGVIMRKTILWCVLYLVIVCVMSFMGV